jgi:hypothetical protein
MANKFGKWGGKFWGDTAERVISTFLLTLIPMWVTVGNVANLDFVNALEVSGSAAGLSLLKCLLANMATGDVPSASAVGVTSLTSDVPPG